MKAYKGTDKDLKCRGLQYELGKEIVHKGDVSPCQNGLHACENPLDVLAYYIPADGARYFEVDCDGDIKHHKCESWREWFGTRWQVIRYTAGEMKARRLLANAVLPPEGQQDAQKRVHAG